MVAYFKKKNSLENIIKTIKNSITDPLGLQKMNRLVLMQKKTK